MDKEKLDNVLRHILNNSLISKDRSFCIINAENIPDKELLRLFTYDNIVKIYKSKIDQDIKKIEYIDSYIYNISQIKRVINILFNLSCPPNSPKLVYYYCTTNGVLVLYDGDYISLITPIIYK